MQAGGLAVSNLEHRAMVEAIAARNPDLAHKTHFEHVMRSLDRLSVAVADTAGTEATV